MVTRKRIHSFGGGKADGNEGSKGPDDQYRDPGPSGTEGLRDAPTAPPLRELVRALIAGSLILLIAALSADIVILVHRGRTTEVAMMSGIVGALIALTRHVLRSYFAPQPGP